MLVAQSEGKYWGKWQQKEEEEQKKYPNFIFPIFPVLYKGKTFGSEFLLFLAIDDRAIEGGGVKLKKKTWSLCYISFKIKG